MQHPDFHPRQTGRKGTMAKKKVAVGSIAEGTRVRVREGVMSPEFADISIAGWTGTVHEVTGKASPTNCILEWDSDTLAKMPADYVTRCEQGGLYHLMACLSEDTLMPLA
jgi:hypothetical protein